MTNRERAKDLFNDVMGTAQPRCIDWIQEALDEAERRGIELAAQALIKAPPDVGTRFLDAITVVGALLHPPEKAKP